MRSPRLFVAAALSVATLLAFTACTTATAANSPSNSVNAALTSAQPTPGTVTPSGPVHMGAWMMTVHNAQVYPHHWNAPAGMPGMWDDMGEGHMAVVFDMSAQSNATPAPNGTYAGPVCTLRGGYGMMGTMMGSAAYGWHMMSPGVYRGPMAFMAPTSTHQFTLVCTDQATGNQASWNVGF